MDITNCQLVDTNFLCATYAAVCSHRYVTLRNFWFGNCFSRFSHGVGSYCLSQLISGGIRRLLRNVVFYAVDFRLTWLNLEKMFSLGY